MAEAMAIVAEVLMTRRVALGFVVSVALAAAAAVPAAAEEIRQGLNPPMILQMFSTPAERPEAVMREMLRPDAVQARPVRADRGQVMPNGSVRYGTAARGISITPRDPCPAMSGTR